MLLSLFIWLVIGVVCGTLSALLVPENSFGWRIESGIGFAGAIAGGLVWPMFDIYLAVGAFNAVIGGVMGVVLALLIARMIRPDLLAYLNPT